MPPLPAGAEPLSASRMLSARQYIVDLKEAINALDQVRPLLERRDVGGYDAARQATRQPMHRDEALVSFNIPLSDESEYEGGGTSFEGSGAVLRPPMGRLLRLRLVERAVCTYVRAHRPMRPPGVVPPRAKLAPPAGPGKPLM